MVISEQVIGGCTVCKGVLVVVYDGLVLGCCLLGLGDFLLNALLVVPLLDAPLALLLAVVLH